MKTVLVLALNGFLPFCATFETTAQVNAWTKPTSGNWEEPYWSLGSLPGPNQSILLTNSGWKAVAIGAATVQNFPQSVKVGSITLSAPADSFNLLLLNYAGYQTPLTADSITVSSNTALTVLASAVDVTNGNTSDYKLEVGGVVNHGAFAAVNTTLLSLGNVGPGSYNMTNGTLVATLGYIGANYSSIFNQFGGYVTPTPMRVLGSGEYDLYDGSLGGSMELYYGGVFKQFGGICNAVLRMDGIYELYGGVYTNNGLMVPSTQIDFGEVIQTGGTNQLGGSLDLGIIGFGPFRPEIGTGYYVLSNGVLRTSGVNVTGGGALEQENGLHVNQGAITITGDQIWSDAIAYGEYYVDGGTLQSDSISIQTAGYFEQTGGTIQLTSGLTVGLGPFAPTFSLTGGSLTAPGAVVNDGVLEQSGGTFTVNALSVSEYPSYGSYGYGYSLSGGQLIVTNMQFSGGALYHSGGAVNQRGTLLLDGAFINEQTTGAQFGPLQLSSSSWGDSTLVLPPTANNCIVRFGDSSGQVWSANLGIQNWAGALKGGGPHQVFFGSNGNALTPAQRTQVLFNNPAGLPSGMYVARLLSTGEIVPDPSTPVAPIAFAATAMGSNQISLSWSNRSGVAAQIEVQRSLTNSGFVTIATVPNNATTFIDSGLTPATSYYYRLRARGTNADAYSQIASATTQAYGVLPAPWISADVGAVGIAGKGLYDGVFHVSGSGADIGGTQDAFQFTYFNVYGGAWNREIVARIPHIDNTDPSAKAGLMIREGTAASDANAFVFVTASGGSGFQARTSSAAGTTSIAGPGGLSWVKLVLGYTNIALNSTVITGFVSADGIHWSTLGSFAGIGANCMGMAVSAHNNSALCEADFYVRTNFLGAAPAAPIIAASIRQNDGTTRLLIDGEFGRIYGVDVSTDLFTWTALTNGISQDFSLTFVDADAPRYARRFYRVFVQP